MLSSSAFETKQSSNSFLKTTTWGRRLAFLTLITLLASGSSFADGKKHKLSDDFEAQRAARTAPQ